MVAQNYFLNTYSFGHKDIFDNIWETNDYFFYHSDQTMFFLIRMFTEISHHFSEAESSCMSKGIHKFPRKIAFTAVYPDQKEVLTKDIIL